MLLGIAFVLVCVLLGIFAIIAFWRGDDAEEGRKRIYLQSSNQLRDLGLDQAAEACECLAIDDRTGTVRMGRRFVETVMQPGGAKALAWRVVEKSLPQFGKEKIYRDQLVAMLGQALQADKEFTAAVIQKVRDTPELREQANFAFQHSQPTPVPREPQERLVRESVARAAARDKNPDAAETFVNKNLL